MFTKTQEQLLTDFADKSDQLFDLGVTSTDSFNGEIGEHVVCLKIREQTEPPFRGKLNQMLKDGFANQI